MKNNFLDASKEIASFIRKNSRELNDAQYGKTFAAWLYYVNGYADWKNPLREWMENIPSNEIHWEFHNLALVHLYEATQDEEIKQFLARTKHRHVAHTNWRMMRALYYAKLGRIFPHVNLWNRKARREAREALKNRVEGFFLDEDKESASLQYHAFSTLLLHWLSREEGFESFQKDAQRGAEILAQFTFSSGETNYFGRGQHQLFGASAAAALFSQMGFGKESQAVLKHILSFQRGGKLPLVLTPDEFGKNSRGGWHSYNRLFDYLPFAGVMFFLAGKSSVKSPLPRTLPPAKNALFSFASVEEKGNHKLVVARPTRSSLYSEYLPWPVVGTTTKTYFLAQGGPDSYAAAPFSSGAPFLYVKGEVEFAGLYHSRFEKNGDEIIFTASTPHYRFVRKIVSNGKTISIHDALEFLRNAHGKLCLVNVPLRDFDISKKVSLALNLKKNGLGVNADVPLVIESAESALGTSNQLRGYVDGNFSKGQCFAVNYSFTPRAKKGEKK